MAMLIPLGAAAQAPATAPASLTTRDAHQNLTIIADPYLAAARYKDVFGKKSPYDAGIVAIQVYFKNDNAAPIRIKPETIELEVSQPGSGRQQLGALSVEDVADRTILNANANPSSRRWPVPSTTTIPGRNKGWNDMVATLRGIALGTDIIPPHNTIHGFVFFDVNHHFEVVPKSQLYISDLSFMTDNKPLFYFEIDLGPDAEK